ncbi:hypothetical protein GCM10022225_24950 [Plantactinospora mayteni]|uniref:Anti-sigma-D factor RsdA sigma factor binding region domain-containing protein n=1 Tax=Plantactinospora mayteni TaxID=566021 RepID=A0ABQ4EJI0_9ACTN|nr:hypothetical protein [Plantactinospora mayteni]GIG94775.1 hypothetical protein Pma05_13480 [Plantactinospora mayteni]
MSTLRSGAERDDGTEARGDAVPGRDGTLTGRDGESGWDAERESARRSPDQPDQPNRPTDDLDPHLGPTADIDPAVVAADDLLLDTLGRAESAPGDDPLAGLLTAWRAELDDDLPAFDLAAALARTMPGQVGERDHAPPDPALGRTAAPFAGSRKPRADESEPVDPIEGSGPDGIRAPRPAVPGRRPRPCASASRSPAGRPGTGPSDSARDAFGRPDRSRPPLRPGRLVRRLVLSSVVGVVLTALLGLGVNHAGPTSPLWPVAAAVYPDRSAVRAAEHTIQLARDAVAERRYAEARAELDRAAVQVSEIRDRAEAGRLRTEVEWIRRGLPGSADRSEAPTGEPPTSVRPVPTTPAAGRTPAPARTPGDAAPPTARSGPAQPAPASPSDRQLLPLPLLPSLLPSGLPLLPSGGCVLLCPPD